MKTLFKTIMFTTLAIGTIATATMMMQPNAADAAGEKLGDMSEKELQNFIGDYLIGNPEIIIEALSEYEKKQEASQQAGFKDKLAEHHEYLYNNDMSPTMGGEDADVTIVEFFDYNCGYCKRAMQDVRKILENDDKVRVIFIELPILSESSRSAAHYALAAAKQGNDKYFDYHVALMEFRGPKNEENLEKVAKDVGLDVDKLKEDANSAEVRMALIKNLDVSKDLGVRGTPAFIIDDTLAPGYIGYDNMTQAVEMVRKAK